MLRLRVLFFTSFCLFVSVLFSKTMWIVGDGAELNVDGVVDLLNEMLGEKVEVVTNDTAYLCAWMNNPQISQLRKRVLEAKTLLISPSKRESAGLTTLALSSLLGQRSVTMPAPYLVASQRPVYTMNGLCDDERLYTIARIATGANCNFIPLPKIWEQVYKDDIFYENMIPKGMDVENYVAAIGIFMGIRGENVPLPSFYGLQKKIAKRLNRSVKNGFAKRDDIFHHVKKMSSISAFPVRVEKEITAIIFDGAFERAIGQWLGKFAEADHRNLRLLYTRDENIETDLPGLFRTSVPVKNVPNFLFYTRPAFVDNTGLTELAHLDKILSHDAKRKNWLPFPLAIARMLHALPTHLIYDNALPVNESAAMFAAMVYLAWTGTVVFPSVLTKEERIAIEIGLSTILSERTCSVNPNAILCKRISSVCYAFSVWRPIKSPIRLSIATTTNDDCVMETLIFNQDNYWTEKIVSVKDMDDAQPERKKEKSSTLFWKVESNSFQGQKTGIRVL